MASWRFLAIYPLEAVLPNKAVVQCLDDMKPVKRRDQMDKTCNMLLLPFTRMLTSFRVLVFVYLFSPRCNFIYHSNHKPLTPTTLVHGDVSSKSKRPGCGCRVVSTHSYWRPIRKGSRFTMLRHSSHFSTAVCFRKRACSTPVPGVGLSGQMDVTKRSKSQ
jgi:hypothetical protein